MDAETNTSVVFFVDDDDGVRGVYSSILRKRGYKVLEAASAEEAGRLSEVFTDGIDVLLMDVNLPDGWGATLAQRLRETHPEMVVVFTTGFADVDPILSSALADAEHVLRKPFNADQLSLAISNAMASRST
ncbi:MAG TPA: response regulator [Longimicrobiales bacterium]|nr:response regulator [Longimicrobiales bacterium]